MTDIYEPYRKMLAGEDVPIHADHPYPGRYALKRGGSYLPVAIDPDAAGVIIARVEGVRKDAAAIWVQCAKHPVTQEAYKFRMAKGHWPDDPPPSDRSNRPTDPLECLIADVKDKVAQGEELLAKGEITTQLDANLARNMQAQLLALKKQADEMFEVEKRPIIEAGNRIGTKYRFREQISNVALMLRTRFEQFMFREEARRKANLEEQIRIYNEERERMERDDPIAFHTGSAPEPPPEPEKVQVGGGFGRKAGLRKVYTAKLVDRGSAVLNFKDDPKVLELIQKLANAQVKAGVREIPGFEIVEGRKAA